MMNLSLFAQGHFRIGTAQRTCRIYSIADRYGGDSRAHCSNYTGGIRARRVWHLAKAVPPRSDVGIHGVHAGCVNLDQNLSGTASQVEYFLQLHHLRLTELFYYDSLHNICGPLPSP
jgi:hypothetical protein